MKSDLKMFHVHFWMCIHLFSRAIAWIWARTSSLSDGMNRKVFRLCIRTLISIFLRSGLSEQMVPKASLSSVSKESIAKLAFLYSLTPLDMQKVIMMALDEDLKLPEDRLRKVSCGIL